MPKYTLEKIDSKQPDGRYNRGGRFLYIVRDEAGVKISERRSHREYVACTVEGGNYFGRVDLAQAFISRCMKKGAAADRIVIAYLETPTFNV